MLSPPTPPPGYFLRSYMFAPSQRSERLEQSRHRGSNLRSGVFFLNDEGIMGRGYDVRLSQIPGSV